MDRGGLAAPCLEAGGYNCEAGADRFAGPRGEARALTHLTPPGEAP